MDRVLKSSVDERGDTSESNEGAETNKKPAVDESNIADNL
jgi:hypothetical protein